MLAPASGEGVPQERRHEDVRALFLGAISPRTTGKEPRVLTQSSAECFLQFSLERRKP